MPRMSMDSLPGYEPSANSHTTLIPKAGVEDGTGLRKCSSSWHERSETRIDAADALDDAPSSSRSSTPTIRLSRHRRNNTDSCSEQEDIDMVKDTRTRHAFLDEPPKLRAQTSDLADFLRDTGPQQLPRQITHPNTSESSHILDAPVQQTNMPISSGVEHLHHSNRKRGMLARAKNAVRLQREKGEYAPILGPKRLESFDEEKKRDFELQIRTQNLTKRMLPNGKSYYIIETIGTGKDDEPTSEPRQSSSSLRPISATPIILYDVPSRSRSTSTLANTSGRSVINQGSADPVWARSPHSITADTFYRNSFVSSTNARPGRAMSVASTEYAPARIEDFHEPEESQSRRTSVSHLSVRPAPSLSTRNLDEVFAGPNSAGREHSRATSRSRPSSDRDHSRRTVSTGPLLPPRSVSKKKSAKVIQSESTAESELRKNRTRPRNQAAVKAAIFSSTPVTVGQEEGLPPQVLRRAPSPPSHKKPCRAHSRTGSLHSLRRKATATQENISEDDKDVSASRPIQSSTSHETDLDPNTYQQNSDATIDQPMSTASNPATRRTALEAMRAQHMIAELQWEQEAARFRLMARRNAEAVEKARDVLKAARQSTSKGRTNLGPMRSGRTKAKYVSKRQGRGIPARQTKRVEIVNDLTAVITDLWAYATSKSPLHCGVDIRIHNPSLPVHAGWESSAGKAVVATAGKDAGTNSEANWADGVHDEDMSAAANQSAESNNTLSAQDDTLLGDNGASFFGGGL
ncbi:unnamed protein product [Tilletia controversa]|uniref:Uncharacterized protein n=3 Tax=Tilletia TaxID=13289 RepID=A0A9N8QAL5_9BASI|nr:hypothetical protein CF336_g8856 [Tilletia laevis]KAE8240720.1 hypothetical protein A4X03_0g8427 [Tilletia caries]CAD6897931.1 unnamed protein product [Tilletia controversa]KAE8182930.1 hypothetical protein CF335_g8479 [Tilletia laevis]CAD6899859.1 unnamed protein product [Tilletia caries]